MTRSGIFKLCKDYRKRKEQRKECLRLADDAIAQAKVYVKVGGYTVAEKYIEYGHCLLDEAKLTRQLMSELAKLIVAEYALWKLDHKNR